MLHHGPLAGGRLAPVPADAAAGYAAELLTNLGAGPGPQVLTVAAAPDSGPVADWAASGAMALTGPAQGPPLVAPGRPATGARGALLALAALTGQDFGFDGHRLLGERAALAGLTPAAPWSAGGSCRAVRSADGWVAVSWARAADDELLPALVEREVHGPAWPVLDAWARDRTSAEVVARATLLGLCLAEIPAAVQEPAAAQEPIAQEPIAQEPVAPGPAAPWRLSGAAGTRTGLPPGALVVDLSALWAGPLCGHLLGLAGARVLRVESSTRPDGGRRGAAGFDDLLHAGQESVALDVTAAQGRAALRTLVDRADVVLTSARPGRWTSWAWTRTPGCAAARTAAG